MRHLVLVTVAFVTACGTATLAVAHGDQNTYAQGYAGVGGVYQTGFNHRHYNQVWHQVGRTWTVLYKLSDGRAVGIRTDSSNPTKWPNEVGYARAVCNNVNDDSFVLWTCQTTGG